MYLGSISFRGIRNLAPATLALRPGLNLVTGENGAGKSAILEALNLLTTARSFRSTRLRNIVTWEGNGFSVQGRYTTADSAAPRPPAIELSHRYDGNESLLHLGAGNRLSRLEVLQRFPSLFVGAESLKFFDDGPAFRRRQLDIGAFHVKHSYIDSWRRYQRALSQRNALLRSPRLPNAAALAPWDQELSNQAEELLECRSLFCDLLEGFFAQHLQTLGLVKDLNIKLKTGWNRETPLSEQLSESVERDFRAGYTLRGPHRDDLVLRVGQRSAASALSRGQQKAFMLALFLSMSEVMLKQTQRPPLLLVDDLGAELDSSYQGAVLDWLSTSPMQSLVSFISPAGGVTLPKDATVFHVEQGRIKQCYNGTDTSTGTTDTDHGDLRQ